MLSNERKGCITASEIGAIAGRGRFNTRADIMRRKVREFHGLPNEFQGNVATQWGKDHEADAIAEWEFISGHNAICAGDNQRFVKTEILAGDGTVIMAGCTPDGLIVGSGIVEVKCPYGKRDEKPNALEYLESAPEYLDQMQWQMMVTNTQVCEFVVWTTQGIDYVPVIADFVRQEQLVAVAMDFQRELNAILAGPELQAPYIADKNAVEHRDDAEFSAAAERYKTALAEYEMANENMELARAELLALVSASTEGCGLKITRSERKGAVDYGKIPELKGVDIEQYRKKSSVIWSIK